MKKNLVVIILSAVIFVLLLGITTYFLLKDDWKGRLEGLLVEYNKVLVDNTKMTEELASLKQKQETPNNTEKSAVVEKVVSSSDKFINSKYTVLRSLKSLNGEYTMIIAADKSDDCSDKCSCAKDGKELGFVAPCVECKDYGFVLPCTECGEGLDVNGQCHFLILPTEWPNDKQSLNSAAYNVKDFNLRDITSENYLDEFFEIKFIDNENVVFSAHTPGDGDGGYEKINLNIVTGEKKTSESIN